MTKDEFIDKLERIREMEEIMAGVLIEISQEGSLRDLQDENKDTIKELLISIREDTLRHKRIVSEILREVSKD
ncbi:MAG: hypothetical protein AB1629_06885 [Candidatus Omnitrophota bacterium]